MEEQNGWGQGRDPSWCHLLFDSEIETVSTFYAGDADCTFQLLHNQTGFKKPKPKD